MSSARFGAVQGLLAPGAQDALEVVPVDPGHPDVGLGKDSLPWTTPARIPFAGAVTPAAAGAAGGTVALAMKRFGCSI